MPKAPRFITPVVLGLVLAGCSGNDGVTVASGTSAEATPVVPATPPAAGTLFADITAASGLRYVNVCGDSHKDYIIEVNGAGACWLDVDRDGELDLYLVNGSDMPRATAGAPGEPNRLYRGLGGGRFEEIADAAGAADRGWGFGCQVGDFDNDGWSDLFVTNYGPNVLYRNDYGRFVDVTAAAGIEGAVWSTTAGLLDIDNDGLLDIYVANYLHFNFADPPVDGKVVEGLALTCKWGGQIVMCGPKGLIAEGDQLFRNAGDGRFVDVTEAAGIAAAPPAYGFVPLPFDYDDDGDVDVYVTNDSVPNHLWRNDGTGHFTEVGLETGSALDETGGAQASMGADAQDYDGDGRIDIAFTNFAKEYHTLLRNLGGQMFMDVSYTAGIAAPTIERLGWGLSFLDVDNDRDLDLFIVNGHVYEGIDATGDAGWKQRSQIFVNDNGRFHDASDGAGPVFQDRRVGRAIALADFDRDGGLDAVVTNLDDQVRLLRNVGRRGHWLGVDLVGVTSTRDAFGARLTVRLAGASLPIVRDHHTGAGYLSAADRRVHFGIGAATVVDELEVRWPSGHKTRLTGLQVDRVVTIREDMGIVTSDSAPVAGP